MKILRAWTLPIATIATLMLATSTVFGQAPIFRASQPTGYPVPTPAPYYTPYGQAPIPAQQAPLPIAPQAVPMMGNPMGNPMMGNPMGNPMMGNPMGMPQQPVSACPSCDGRGCAGCAGSGMYRGGGLRGMRASDCGPGGCGRGGLLGGGFLDGDGLLGGRSMFGGCGPNGCSNGLLGFLLPYGDGGCAAPRWLDIHAEVLHLKREDVSRNVQFTSLGADPNNIVLQSDDLEFDDEFGFRVTGAYMVGPGSNLEVNFMGGFNYADSAQVTDGTDALFSVFSEYGTNPVNGFLETDRSELHRIEYSTSMDSISLDYRRRWQGMNSRLQGSYLCGFRYFQVDEGLRHVTDVSRIDPLDPLGPPIEAGMNYVVSTRNALAGFQIGGDGWLCVMPGLRFGAEAKVGIYNNRARQLTSLAATTVIPTLTETDQTDSAAFVGEAGFMMTYRVNYQTTFRAGYQAVYADGLALATENFNGVPPNVFTGVPGTRIREQFLNTGGDAFYHGFTAGIEWMW
ncbi:MAG: hypothetical protein ACI9HK_003944 [Pirellulaceae bacterium]|jgi:hypothetical protein